MSPARRFRPAVTHLEDRATPATHTWTGTGATDNWSDPGNWAGGVPTSGEPGGTIVVFDTTDNTITQDIAGLTIDRLQFDVSATARVTLRQSLAVSGATLSSSILDQSGKNSIDGSGSLVLVGGPVDAVMDFEAGALTVGATLAGSQDLRKSGIGTLALTATTATGHSGTLRILDGTVRVATATDDQGVTASIVVGNDVGFAGSAVLELAGANEVPNAATVAVRSDGLVRVAAGATEDLTTLTFDGTGGGGRAFVEAGGNLSLLAGGAVAVTSGATTSILGTGTLTLLGGVTFNVADVDPGTDLVVNAPIAGPGTLVKTGVGAMSVADSGTYALGRGLVRIDGGTLLAGAGADKVTFDRTGFTLTGQGGAGNDSFLFAPRDGYYDVFANGVRLRFDPNSANILVFLGNGGNDRADLYPVGSGNTAGLAATYGVLSGASGYTVYTGSFMETVTVHGHPGDVGYLAGGEGADVFGAGPAFGPGKYATMVGSGFNNTLADFDSVVAYGNGGVDTAYLNGSAGNDTFVATPTYASLAGTGYANSVSGFEGVVATGGGGTDTAYLTDSDQVDTIVASGTKATLTLPTVTISVDGFVGVVAYGTNGGVNRKQVGAINFFLDLQGVWVG